MEFYGNDQKTIITAEKFGYLPPQIKTLAYSTEHEHKVGEIVNSATVDPNPYFLYRLEKPERHSTQCSLSSKAFFLFPYITTSAS